MLTTKIKFKNKNEIFADCCTEYLIHIFAVVAAVVLIVWGVSIICCLLFVLIIAEDILE